MSVSSVIILLYLPLIILFHFKCWQDPHLKSAWYCKLEDSSFPSHFCDEQWTLDWYFWVCWTCHDVSCTRRWRQKDSSTIQNSHCVWSVKFQPSLGVFKRLFDVHYRTSCAEFSQQYTQSNIISRSWVELPSSFIHCGFHWPSWMIFYMQNQKVGQENWAFSFQAIKDRVRELEKIHRVLNSFAPLMMTNVKRKFIQWSLEPP
jgi:hypothetical protein